jgi:hypothetical protein
MVLIMRKPLPPISEKERRKRDQQRDQALSIIATSRIYNSAEFSSLSAASRSNLATALANLCQLAAQAPPELNASAIRQLQFLIDACSKLFAWPAPKPVAISLHLEHAHNDSPLANAIDIPFINTTPEQLRLNAQKINHKKSLP